MSEILLTAFDAFGGLTANPSEAVVRAIAADWPGPSRLRWEILPTVYDEAEQRLLRLIEASDLAAVVLLGVARARGEVQLERVALNLDDSEVEDNRGERRRGRRIEEAGPVGYWATLDLEVWLATLQAHGVAASISNHAGTFLCNHVFFRALAHLEASGRAIPCGFVHVPGHLGEESGPSVDDVAAALRACLATVVN